MLSQNGNAVGESGRVNFVNHELRHQKPAEINTTPNPSTPETGGKVEAKQGQQRAFTSAILQFRRGTEQFRDSPEQLKDSTEQQFRSPAIGCARLNKAGRIA
jgi:hypothetical protein